MEHPGKGRPFKKGIMYTTPQKNVKDYGIDRKHSKKPTSGLESVASTPDNARPFPRV